MLFDCFFKKAISSDGVAYFSSPGSSSQGGFQKSALTGLSSVTLEPGSDLHRGISGSRWDSSCFTH